MTILRTNTVSGVGTNGPVFDGSLEFNSQNYVILPKGTTGDRVGVGSTTGALRYNTDSNKVELYDGNQWVEVQSSRPDLNGGARGVFGGGYIVPASQNTIDYITISSTGNALDFGDLTLIRLFPGSCSSSTRGIFSGGAGPAPTYTVSNVIDYVTISSTGNATDFGDLTVARADIGSCSSSTRGIFGGGNPATNTIDYVTIASIGNAVDFGDLTVTRRQLAGCSSPTRGIFAGGFVGPTSANTIDFITIATLGNATDFGDLTIARNLVSGCSSSTRGIFGGGNPTTNIIEFITIATLGNAVKFGDLTVARYSPGACSSSTRAVFGGGNAASPVGDTNTIDYVTILTQGNAVDFGDLTQARNQLSALSNAHGGL
jgi:hypothetical protein